MATYEKEFLLKVLENLWKVRKFEQRAMEGGLKGEIKGNIHVCLGEEGAVVGANMALEPTDYITASHRGHGHCVMKSDDLEHTLAELYGMDTDQIEYAAEVAMEHHLGLTCDPVMGLVQVPCIERNAVAAMRAINAVSLANFLTYTRKISFDLIVETMYQTGKDLSKIYRETSEGGLAKLYKPAQKNESTEEIK